MADNNIIFIGMPAVGKSTVGVVIAKRLGYRFVDTDILIQESEGKLLKDIIADVGPDGFLKVEDQVNAQVKAERTVISPGGSVVYMMADFHLSPDKPPSAAALHAKRIRTEAQFLRRVITKSHLVFLDAKRQQIGRAHV